MSEPCGKQRFPTKGAAGWAMRRVPASATGRVPTKIYWCGPCRAWHYTTHAIASQKRKRSAR